MIPEEGKDTIPWMEAVVLGTADGLARPGRNHAGILLWDKNQSLLLDCGAPVEQWLVGEAMDVGVPSRIWLSHMHSDHVAHFPILVQTLWLRHRKTPLEVSAPAGAVAGLKKLLEHCLLLPEILPFPIHWTGIVPGRKDCWGEWELTAFGTTHLCSGEARFGKYFPTICFCCCGVLVEWPSGSCVYSADLGCASDLRPVVSEPVRILFCELAHVEPADLFRELLGRPVEEVWLIHYPDQWVGQEENLQKIASEAGFTGKVRLAREGMRISL
ncbi:MBL fold metallo-hydrolase [Candidatus Methylacidithermus pantelleriae]|uniref:MBL fold metallo-hydrolase n=1 Tax=Candidatus Methylacidithermus pantelleriae TaxID=2744239 RepID=UPI00157CFE3C|nr:MBL fold metallo-hydrolase [Candidatus Methylacidithermus pantelleriae]